MGAETRADTGSAEGRIAGRVEKIIEIGMMQKHRSGCQKGYWYTVLWGEGGQSRDRIGRVRAGIRTVVRKAVTVEDAVGFLSVSARSKLRRTCGLSMRCSFAWRSVICEDGSQRASRWLQNENCSPAGKRKVVGAV